MLTEDEGVETTQKFIDRKRVNSFIDQEQLAKMIEVFNYCISEVPGLPESISFDSDGDSYAILWKDEIQSLSIDVFNWSGQVRICWIYHGKDESITWLDFSQDIDPDTIPSENLIVNLKKLVKS